MIVHNLEIDLRKPFTLFEACPETQCIDPHGTSSPCAKCGGARGRVRGFDTLEELREYVTNTPVW